MQINVTATIHTDLPASEVEATVTSELRALARDFGVPVESLTVNAGANAFGATVKPRRRFLSLFTR